MNRQSVYAKLNEVFRDVFDDEDITVVDETTADDIEDWDSLMHINLVSAVEDEFDVEFEMKDILELNNVGDFVDLIIRVLEE